MKTIFNMRKELAAELRLIKNGISDEYRAFEDDDKPGIQVTLACNDDGTDYALQTGDNSYSGAAYGFPHWAVSAVYRTSNCRAVAKELIDQLHDLIEE